MNPHIRTCTHTYTHVHTRTHMCTHVHTCTHTYTHVHTRTHMYTHVHTCTHMYIHVHTRTHMYIHVHTRTHTYTHVHTNTYTCKLHIWNVEISTMQTIQVVTYFSSTVQPRLFEQGSCKGILLNRTNLVVGVLYIFIMFLFLNLISSIICIINEIYLIVHKYIL